VTLETELGAIEIAMMPENAPEAARNFLNLSATVRSIRRRLVASSKVS
jgi:cyclophilin family peptidyl-prolyl cis-trans isomerase